jgi:hypothetical protein
VSIVTGREREGGRGSEMEGAGKDEGDGVAGEERRVKS